MEYKFGLGTIIAALGLIATVAIYAMDWQRDQDAHLNKLDQLIIRQTTILEMQSRFNEQTVQPASAPVLIPFSTIQPATVAPTTITPPVNPHDSR